MKGASIILLFLTPAISWAQTRIDTTYQVELVTTACPIISFYRYPRVPGTVNEASVGYGMYVRGMWHPGRLLSVGLMTGYLVIAKDEIAVDRSLAGQLTADGQNYNARLAAIPLQVAISMQKHDFEIGMGIGPYLMLSTIEGGSSASAHGNRLELGMTFFSSYFFSLNDNIKIGPDLRVLYFRYRGILSLMPSCSVHIVALRY